MHKQPLFGRYPVLPDECDEDIDADISDIEAEPDDLDSLLNPQVRLNRQQRQESIEKRMRKAAENVNYVITPEEVEYRRIMNMDFIDSSKPFFDSIDDYNTMLRKRNDMRDGKLVPIWDEKSTGAWNSLLTQPYLTEEERQQEYVRVMRLQNNGNVLF